MSTPDSRKSFLSKLALCALAAGTMPGLIGRRWFGLGTSGPDTAAGGPTPVIAVKPDPRAVAREAVTPL